MASREIHAPRAAPLGLWLMLLFALPGCLKAQEPGKVVEPGSAVATAGQDLAALTATPESAAELFLRSVRAIRWSAATQFMHDETLARFYTTARMMAAADTSGEVSRYLVEADSVGLIPLEPATVFARSIGATIDGMPGLMHSLYDRDDEVLGHVPEDDTTAHVVYRSTPRLSGAVSEVKVMQVRRSAEGGWRVLWSDELEVLDAALRGVGR